LNYISVHRSSRFSFFPKRYKNVRFTIFVYVYLVKFYASPNNFTRSRPFFMKNYNSNNYTHATGEIAKKRAGRGNTWQFHNLSTSNVLLFFYSKSNKNVLDVRLRCMLYIVRFEWYLRVAKYRYRFNHFLKTDTLCRCR